MRAPLARYDLGRPNPQTVLVPAVIYALPIGGPRVPPPSTYISGAFPRPRRSGSDDDGVNIVMPSLGFLHEKVISGEALTSSFRQITDILFGAMASTTLFRTRQFYNKVTSMHLDKYPQLRDVAGSGSDSWKVALRNKFKNQRRKLQDDCAVQNRKKFGAQRRTEAAAKELQRSKKPKMAIGLPNLTGEDENSMAKREEWLILESKKYLPNEKALQERMALTANQTS
nr:sterile alpha motif domain-containing protein 3-like [Dermacentor andersoni]